MRGLTIKVGPLEKMKWQVATYNTTRALASSVTTFASMFRFTENNPGIFHTWEVEDVKVTVVTQHRAVPLVGQTCNFPVGFEWALDQGNSSLDEDLDEHLPCEDWENGAIAAVRKPVGLLYRGLKTVAYGGELLIAGVNTCKSQQSRSDIPYDWGGVQHS